MARWNGTAAQILVEFRGRWQHFVGVGYIIWRRGSFVDWITFEIAFVRRIEISIDKAIDDPIDEWVSCSSDGPNAYNADLLGKLVTIDQGVLCKEIFGVRDFPEFSIRQGMTSDGMARTKISTDPNVGASSMV